MGKADVAVRQWLSDKGRFADLFNGVVFQGEEVVLAGALEELYEDGIEQGKRDTAINLKRMGLALDQIAQAVEENVSVVRVWLEGSKLKK